MSVACSSVSSTSTNTLTQSARKLDAKICKRKRNTKFSDCSLCPASGVLQCRLDQTCHHWPIPHTGMNPKCQLHCWGGGKMVKSHIMSCSTCNVSLCVQCFQMFHEERNLVARKAEFVTHDICPTLKDGPSMKTSAV